MFYIFFHCVFYSSKLFIIIITIICHLYSNHAIKVNISRKLCPSTKQVSVKASFMYFVVIFNIMSLSWLSISILIHQPVIICITSSQACGYCVSYFSHSCDRTCFKETTYWVHRLRGYSPLWVGGREHTWRWEHNVLRHIVWPQRVGRDAGDLLDSSPTNPNF